jgi:hypothetical protein
MAVLMMGSACRRQFSAPDVNLTVQLDPEFQLVTDVTFDNPPPGFTVESFEYNWFLEGRYIEDIETSFVQESALAYAQTWRVEVTPIDSTGRVGQFGTAELHLAAAPSLEVALAPTEPTTTDRLETFVLITGGFMSDPTYSLRWFVDGEPRPEFDDLGQIPSSETHRDEEWRVELHAVDPWSAVSPSATIKVQNTAPIVKVASFYPTRPMTESMLQAQVNTTDVDGDPVGLSYTWFVNDVEVPDESRSMLDGTKYFDRGDQVAVVVRADDGTDFVEERIEIAVGNTPPMAPTVRIPESPVVAGEPFHCAVREEAYDADGDPVTYDVRWSARSVPLTETETYVLADDSVPEGLTQAGVRYVCQVVPNDGIDDGIAGVMSVPVSLPYIAVDAGDVHSCAITDEEAIDCQGDNTFGQSSPPGGRYTGIATGLAHSCGLSVDGSAVCFGSDVTGQLQAPNLVFSALDAGWYHTCGIVDDGSVECWGQSSSGQLDAPTDQRFTQLSAGAFHTCGVTVTQDTVCWGWDDVGQLDAPDMSFQHVSVGFLHSCGVDLFGDIHCWGDNSAGQLDATTNEVFVEVGAGDEFSCGLTEQGRVRCWGNNAHGQVDAPDLAFEQIRVGSRHACGITDNAVAVCWGDPSAGSPVFFPSP